MLVDVGQCCLSWWVDVGWLLFKRYFGLVGYLLIGWLLLLLFGRLGSGLTSKDPSKAIQKKVGEDNLQPRFNHHGTLVNMETAEV